VSNGNTARSSPQELERRLLPPQPDGRERGCLDETSPTLQTQSSDGCRAIYRYRGFGFTIERHGFTWHCTSQPRRIGCLADIGIYETSWDSLTRRGILAKLKRHIDQKLRDETRRRGVRHG
jgi:hypothetical protein